ncbi:MAG: ATP-binding cassette domain-containing protein, partial [Candidatus Omnitrophica bacterium]|nr:ATP-binding cassette domain-containing protein [Candidatus Omnitrophota bacterium]
MIAGMLVPDRGEIRVEGKVSTLMELGAGFNHEFTGKENILLNAGIYGIEEEYLDSRMEEIIEFTGLGKFINAPVKYYSQGMFMRLAFALAIYVEPDILLIDDILAVGDREAQEKCIKKVFELKQKGKTIIVVSHDMEMVKKLCNRVILLEKGRIIQNGPPEEVISTYLERLESKKKIILSPEEEIRLCLFRTITSGELSLYADVEAKSLRLYYRDKE